MKNRTIISRAVKRALIVGVAASSALTFQTLAQDGQESSIERIEVTGSRINRTDMETASPVTVISDDFIVKNGYQSVEEILSAQPSAAGMSLGASSNNGSGGSATVNLRGMGSQRTLVLLNGRRMVASGIGADSSVDLNTIPVAMIKSIEILKDGASAVYGSDAIAGVVNIITKKDFEGTELTADASITGKYDGETGGFSLLHGTEVAGGNLVVGLQYSNRGEVIQSDRDFVPPGSSSYVPGGSLGGKVKDEEGNWVEREEGYDYTTSSYAQTPNELTSLFSSYTKEFNNDIEFSADLMYTHRDSQQQMAPQPASIMLDTSMIDDEHLNHEDFYGEDGELVEELEYRRRMTDAGPRIYQQQTDTYRASIGLKGYLENDDSWDISATYGRNDSKDSIANSVHAGNMEKSIYANQGAWFSGDELSRDFLTDEEILYTEQNEGGNEQFILAAGYSGLTESDIGYAFGFEHRYDSGFYTPDQIIQDGESTAAQQDPTEGSYSVNSLYGEVSVPVTDQFSVEGAARYDDYSTFGGAATWKLGATYEFTDSFMIRAVAATGFRAPNVSELYGGNTGSFDYLEDPWGNEEDPQILVNYTSDENLKPEESESVTFGMVWEIADGISTTIDYWSFDVTNAISRVDVQSEMNKCFLGDQMACETINITPEGDLSNMTAALTNIGSQDTAGIDWNLSMVFDSTRVMIDTTYLTKFEQDGVDYTGSIDGMMGGYSQLKSNISIFHDISDDTSIQYNGQFIQGMHGNYYGEAYRTNDVIYHNISATHFINDAWRVNGGIKNLLDTEPEVVPDGNDMNTVPSIYDVIGRTFFISTTYNF
ncbi:TonB-dependent receptor plug domain-containing protein [Thalassotalea sp. PLHSN55]|uniref:TonB-dependent receptor plug domain-containing protein n=1 Tax=Thalassotalea sp. PLHSN55 TaxID=3435888 RepID=UPI003F82B470